MADWTTIPDTTFEPGAPAKGRDIRFLRDNPIAIAEGAPGAPRIAGQQGPVVRAAGLFSGNAERDWVLARCASASVGAVGTYAMLRGQSDLGPGSTVSGSNLNYIGALHFFSIDGASGTTQSHSATLGASPAGTWRCMSNLSASVGVVSQGSFRAGLFLRIS